MGPGFYKDDEALVIHKLNFLLLQLMLFR